MQSASVPSRPARAQVPPRPSSRMEEIHCVLWAAIHHLFPAHSKARPTSTGGLAISWAMEDDPHATFSHAAPILIRLEENLVDAMCMATHEQQRNIARRQEIAVRAGMTGYDPYAPVPKARVIVLG
jgi:hypothetical protein